KAEGASAAALQEPCQELGHLLTHPLPPGALREARRSDLRCPLQVIAELRLQATPTSASRTMSVTSSLSASERLSKFIVPMEDQRPSTTKVSACSVDGCHP